MSKCKPPDVRAYQVTPPQGVSRAMSLHAGRGLLGRRGQRLHRLVCAVAGLGVLHYLWLVKKDVTEPLIYGGMLLPWGRRLLRGVGGRTRLAERRDPASPLDVQ